MVVIFMKYYFIHEAKAFKNFFISSILYPYLFPTHQ